MRSLLNVFLFVPMIIYIAFLAMNWDLLGMRGDANFFFLASIKQAPILAFTIIFFCLYVLLIWLLLKFSNLFTEVKTARLGNKVDHLKAELYDKQDKIINNIKKEFEGTLKKIKEDNDKKLEATKKETEKISSNLEYELKKIQDLMKKIGK